MTVAEIIIILFQKYYETGTSIGYIVTVVWKSLVLNLIYNLWSRRQ